jgi:hypothetical protein
MLSYEVDMPQWLAHDEQPQEYIDGEEKKKHQ